MPDLNIQTLKQEIFLSSSVTFDIRWEKYTLLTAYQITHFQIDIVNFNELLILEYFNILHVQIFCVSSDFCKAGTWSCWLHFIKIASYRTKV